MNAKLSTLSRDKARYLLRREQRQESLCGAIGWIEPDDEEEEEDPRGSVR
jgi:hypothetical protein